MKKFFVNAETAYKLKELGFNDRCMTVFNKGKLMFPTTVGGEFVPISDAVYWLNSELHSDELAAAPLIDQAVDFLLFLDVAIDTTRSFGGKYIVMVRDSKQVLKMYNGTCKHACNQEAVTYLLNNYDLSAIKNRFEER